MYANHDNEKKKQNNNNTWSKVKRVDAHIKLL